MPKKKLKKDWSGIKKKIKDRKKKYSKDERIYNIVFNDKKSSKVTMRFLDSPDTDMPYIDHSKHIFSDQNGWCFADCPTTVKGTGQGICPICDDLYSGNYYDNDRETYFDRKKKTAYYTNVLIIKDDNTPSNEGKVFLFEFKVKIMEKVDDIIEEDMMPWDEDEGTNFTLSAKKGANNMTNYDASRFSDTTTSLSDFGDVDAILKERHSLAAFHDESKFLTYDEIKVKYESTIGESSASNGRTTRKPVEEDVEEEDDIIDDDVSDTIGDEDMFEEGDGDEFFDDLDGDDED